MAHPARLARAPTTGARRVTFSFFKVFSYEKGFTDLHPDLCEAGLTSGAIQRHPEEIGSSVCFALEFFSTPSLVRRTRRGPAP